MRFSSHKPLKKRMKPAHMPFELSIQYADASAQSMAARSTLRRWVRMSLEAPARITLRFVRAQEGRALNQAFRGKDYATNVLTFNYDVQDLAHTGVQFAADIVICPSVVRKEAKAQGKPVRNHLAHLVIHGVLHAQGHDHEQPKQAQRMEAREVELLASLRIANPYESIMTDDKASAPT
jgi:probable rRNA maturation factor